MELYHLRSFVMVANEGHLTRAAQRLYTSQPSVSAHIKALEEELGVTLFVRTPKGMELTEEGQLLKTQAEKCLASVSELFQQARLLHEYLVGILKIGLNTSPEVLRIGEFFAAMTANYPKLEFHLLQRNSWEILDEVKSGDLDAGYIFGDNPSLELTAIRLETCHLRIVGPRKWQERLEHADWQEIAEFPWIWIPDRCPFHKIASELFQKHNLRPAKVIVADQETTLKNLVISGVGLSLMIEDEAVAAEREGTVVLWEKEMLPIDLSFVYLQKRASEPAIQAMLNGICIVWGTADQYFSVHPRESLSFS